jgi:hypothetical protein
MNDWLNTPVSSEATGRVHSGVMRRIRRRRQARRGAGAMAVLAVLAFAFWPSPPELEKLALSPPPPPPAPVWTPPPPAPRLTPKQVPVLMAKATPRPAERITILTDDPDVVIVLVADGGE